MLPALNIQVIYHSTPDHHYWQIPVAMLAGIAVCIGCAVAVFGRFNMDQRTRNALILGCAFGNVTYLGMPLLRGLFASQLQEATEIAILCEITVTSMDLVAGTLLAAVSKQTGEHVSTRAILLQLAKFPLLWSVAIAAALHVLNIPLPTFVEMSLQLLGSATSGLMLLVLGMALKPEAIVSAIRKIRLWWPMVLIKLGISPVVVALAASAVGLSDLHFTGTVLEASMPPQLFVFIVADKFGFDTELLAPAVALLTVLSFLTLPIVHMIVVH
jgi:predicted permease